jgi:hypothetical protein
MPGNSRRWRHNPDMTDDLLPVAEAVRKACIEAALAAYEDAGISGLCAEGRWEAAVSAMQSLALKHIRGSEGDRTAAPHSRNTA